MIYWIDKELAVWSKPEGCEQQSYVEVKDSDDLCPPQVHLRTSAMDSDDLRRMICIIGLSALSAKFADTQLCGMADGTEGGNVSLKKKKLQEDLRAPFQWLKGDYNRRESKFLHRE